MWGADHDGGAQPPRNRVERCQEVASEQDIGIDVANDKVTGEPLGLPKQIVKIR
jgi:hypothetical protein